MLGQCTIINIILSCQRVLLILKRMEYIKCALLCAALAPGYARVCDPLAFGAVGNGRVYDTAAIRSAVDLCGASGGGTVLFRYGYTFLTGAFNVSSNTILQIDGTVLGSPNSTGYSLVDPLPWYGPDPPQKSSAKLLEGKVATASRSAVGLGHTTPRVTSAMPRLRCCVIFLIQTHESGSRLLARGIAATFQSSGACYLFSCVAV
jgi:hypothetical protein